MNKILFESMRRSTVLLCMLTMIAATALAVPAKPGQKRTLTLADGKQVVATLVGDEHGHYWLAADGKIYQSIGENVYAEADIQQVKQRANQRRAAANQRRMRRLAPRKVGEVNPITGKKKGLIILVNFTDVSFKTANNQALYTRIANEENFSYGDFKGSMYDYFKAQSEGQFELTFDVVGPVTVSKTQAYYGTNSGKNGDAHAASMVIEAIKLADSQVNYKDYDWDGDGEVDQVYVVYAGQGEADGGDDDTIWPHEWTLDAAKYYGDGSGSFKLDGVKINTYACGSELNGSNKIAGIGTMCHEFSHCLGYPDFYDTDYSGGQGMYMWDLMDTGSYNGNGYKPAGYTSYERWMAGWKTPIELVNTQSVTGMKALQNGGETYVIYNKANTNEYFLLENRQKVNWDSGVPGAGLLILHVDYSSSVWESNQPNDDPSHQRMTWIPADNQYQTYTDNGEEYIDKSGAATDPFPYGSVNAFGRNTTPAATLFNANSDGTKYLDSSVEDITQNADGTISFNFVGISNVATPTFSPAAGRYETAQTVSITCETNGAKIYYTLDGSTPTTASTLYTSALTISETTTVKSVAAKDGDLSAVATATYKIGASISNPDTKTFRLVTSTSDLEDGLRYVIACGSQYMAAGALSSQILGNVQVTFQGDVLTTTDNVAVFVLEQTSDGWALKNEKLDQYLYATNTKNLAYGSTAESWTLADGTAGVIMSFGSYGTMLYNTGSPRFTTYTSSASATMIQANLYVEDSSSTPVTTDPLIVADEALTFNTTVGNPQQLTFDVLSAGLTEDITVTLTDANNVFSLGQTSISRTESELGATGSVTFNPSEAGTYTALVTLSSAGADDVTISLTATATEGSASDPTTKAFKRVTSAANLESGKRYIIACGSKNTAAGTFHTSYLDSINVTVKDDVITINDNVAVFVIEGNQTSGWTLKNESTGQYLYATAAKALAYGTSAQTWTLSDGTDGVILTYGSYGTMLYNVGSPRFTTYTSKASASMIQANLYMEESDGGQTPVKNDVTLTFSPTTVEAKVGETFTAPTLTIDPEGITVKYSSSNTEVATVDASTGDVTILAAGETTITATFEGNDSYNPATASYQLTVAAADTPATGGETLLYESLSGYSSDNDGSNEIQKTNSNLDYNGWASFTKIYAGGASGAYAEGGCLKLGSSNAAGSMQTGSISLTGKATLTFYLKKYNKDTGKLNVTVTGATADVTQFTPSDTWTLCTVQLTNAQGEVTITLATSSKRAYLDEIKLVTAGAESTESITLDELAANAETLSAYAGKTVDVTLDGRTLWKDGEWNTLSLPFDLDLESSVLEGADLRKLNSATFANNTLTLNFVSVTQITAGQPYIIKWTSGENLVNPTFKNVVISQSGSSEALTEKDVVRFVANFESVDFTGGNTSVLYMGADSKLFYPNADFTMGAFRAYFVLNDAYFASDPAGTNGIKNIIMDFGTETAVTRIESRENALGEIYDLNGRRVQTPTKGLYIINGRKVYIK